MSVFVRDWRKGSPEQSKKSRINKRKARGGKAGKPTGKSLRFGLID